MQTINSVYWIHHKDHTDMFSEGYIGVTVDTEVRWKRHSRHSENQHLKNAITKYGWDNLIKEVILVSDEKYCYDIETKLRPKENTGWNISPGGDKPPTSKPRGPNYISPLKGIPKKTPWMLGRKPWNTGITGHWSDNQRSKFIAGVSKPHSEDHIVKRQATRKATRIARGQIKAVILNGIEYESAVEASKKLNIPEPTIKHWCYGKGKPGKKYMHIIECRWK